MIKFVISCRSDLTCAIVFLSLTVVEGNLLLPGGKRGICQIELDRWVDQMQLFWANLKGFPVGIHVKTIFTPDWKIRILCREKFIRFFLWEGTTQVLIIFPGSWLALNSTEVSVIISSIKKRNHSKRIAVMTLGQLSDNFSVKNG